MVEDGEAVETLTELYRVYQCGDEGAHQGLSL